ncbi:MAG TPA: CheR family methyltransferase [Anaerolineales bacterium]|nr:CheR family methyltransferase [Anaerolineales bacterium]
MASKNKNRRQSPPSTKSQHNSKTENPKTSQASGLTIVGIGASAGGLKALQTFFEALPSDTGMAYVVVTHLHPEHESHLAELLQTRTCMPVNQVTGPIGVEKDHVYVIPPNRRMMMADAKLDLAKFEEPRGQRTPIDQFFRSLASSHPNSVGIILSGGGTDGAVGIKAIKEVGGLLMVQHPEDAEYDSMPQAAIATGLADVVLPVRELARKLGEYTRLTPEVPTDPDELNAQQAELIQQILTQVHARTGHDFSQYKRTTVLRRIQRRMQLNGYATLGAYLDYLRHNPHESTAMFNDVLIGVTSFFRDRASWEALAKKVLPAIFTGKEAGEPVRAWTIGCSTGEETYSLAILFLEHAATLHQPYQIQVFASDIDENSLARARAGLYPTAIEADVSAERLERFFIQQGDHYQVRREVRDLVLFTNHSVLRDPPFSRQDLIACRNLLIYLQREVQDTVFEIFHYVLNPGGYLYLGSAESAESADDLFQTMEKTHRIYQARPGRVKHPRIPYLSPTMRQTVSAQLYPLRLGLRKYIEDRPVVAAQHQTALETFGPPSVLVSREYAVLHVSETAGRFLIQPKGPITNDLLRLVRAELQSELRSALFLAFEEGKAIITRPVDVHFNGKPHPVVLSVHPRKQAAAGKPYEMQALVVFLEDELHKLSEVTSETQEAADARSKTQSDALVMQLEAEIQRLREQLQTTTEEYDSSVEEMKAANEELQSMNEEYRSTTEELETSKEELQSVNEELQTVNNELKNKLDEISRAHSDLENLISATEIATLFLDRELHIQRFTPGIADLFNIMPSDRGRPIGHLTHKLGYAELAEDARQVSHQPTPVEREVRGQNGAWYLVRLRPYRTVEDKVDGVVITFVDITKLKEAEHALLNLNETLEQRVLERTEELNQVNQKLSQAGQLFYTLFHANPIPTTLTRLSDGQFIDVNDAYLQYYGLEGAGVIGRTADELNLPLAPNVRPGLMARVQQEGKVRNIELDIDHPSGETRTILASLQRIDLDDAESLISTFTDITARVRAERQVRVVASNLTASEQVERHRISRLLHDELQQNIFAVKMQLSFLDEAIERNDVTGLKLDLQQLDKWLAKAIEMIRQLSIDLSPPVLHGEGLAEALIWLAAQMKEQYGLDVIVAPKGLNVTFQEDVRMLVFQSVRELLFNVVKHSGTLQAQITFEQVNDTARITISDRGKGFDSEAMLKDLKTGHGLLRMRDRLFLLGCNLIVDSKPDKGTQATIEAPIKDIID